MKSYCLKCKKDTENINLRVSNTSNGKTILLSKYAKCESKKSRFIKNQLAKGLLSNLVTRTTLSKGPLLGDILFQKYKMNEMVNKFLLAGDKFMPEMHLKQPGFTYSAFGDLLKTKKEFKNLKEQEIQTIFTKMNLIKLVFNMIWHMEILKIQQEEQFLIKF